MTNLPNNKDTFHRVGDNSRSVGLHKDLHNDMAETLEALQKFSGAIHVTALPANPEVGQIYTLIEKDGNYIPGTYLCTSDTPTFLNVGGVKIKENGGLLFDGIELATDAINPDNLVAKSAGYLTGGTAVTLSNFTTLGAGANNGKFSININGTDYNDVAVDLSTATDEASIAALIQTAIRAATSSTEMVVWDTDKFIITSAYAGNNSKVLKLMSPTTGTDISGAGYLDLGVNASETYGTGDDYKLVRLDEDGKLREEMLPLNTVSLVAGENVASKKVVAVTALTSSGQTENPSGGVNGSTDSYINNRKFSTYFTTPNQGVSGTMKLTTFSMGMSSSGGTLTGTMFSELFLAGVDNLPTGPVLSTSDTISAGSGNMTFTNAIVAKNTKYCVVTTITSSSGNSRFTSISGPNPVYSTWEWNGTAWVGTLTLLRHISTTWDVTKEGEVSLATSASNNQLANNVVGFTVEAKNAGELVKVQINGIVSGLSGLTTGSTYYLGTAGGISASAGSQSRKLGIAISTTQLLIIRDNIN